MGRGPRGHGRLMEELLKSGTLFLSSIAEGAAGLVIAFAVLEAIVRSAILSLPAGWRGSVTHHLMEKEEVRLRLGRWLAVALEFLLAADILRTAVAPTWHEIGNRAAAGAPASCLT